MHPILPTAIVPRILIEKKKGTLESTGVICQKVDETSGAERARARAQILETASRSAVAVYYVRCT